jgi:hypothetical protein
MREILNFSTSSAFMLKHEIHREKMREREIATCAERFRMRIYFFFMEYQMKVDWHQAALLGLKMRYVNAFYCSLYRLLYYIIAITFFVVKLKIAIIIYFVRPLNEIA